jgi:hypothetical protein
MKNIAQALIKAKFPNLESTAVLEIAEKTGNPELAIELLCGLYTPPEVASFAMLNNVQCTAKRYDKWEDKVYYEYLKEKVVNIYIPKGMNHALITPETYEEYRVKWSNDGSVENIDVKTGLLELTESYCNLEKWNKSKNIPEDLINSLL